MKNQPCLEYSLVDKMLQQHTLHNFVSLIGYLQFLTSRTPFSAKSTSQRDFTEKEEYLQIKGDHYHRHFQVSIFTRERLPFFMRMHKPFFIKLRPVSALR